MRICLVYDRLYPLTIGGVERWMRRLGERLVEDGHEVTYVTMRHWPRHTAPHVPGVALVVLGPRVEPYGQERRRLLPPLLFGIGVLRHLGRHGRRYDVVHLASFPYFPLLAAAALRRVSAYSLVVDWHEVWTLDYWRTYAGRLVGVIGWGIQRLCIRTEQRAFCVSRLHERRLRAEGFRGDPELLPGLYEGPTEPTQATESEPLVLYAGRHVKEKRVPALVAAFALARLRRPGLRLAIYGTGPERGRVLTAVSAHGLDDVVEAPGLVEREDLEQALARAACLVTASEREGYGLVVVEAAARGTPSVIVAGPENAAVELVEEGVNGTVATSAAPEELAEAILRAVDAGPALRRSTARWFAANATRLSLDRSYERVLAAYRECGG